MREELKEVIEKVLEVEAVSEEDSAQTVASWDSVRHLSLILALEERFGVTFEADQIPELISVRAIEKALNAPMPARQSQTG